MAMKSQTASPVGPNRELIVALAIVALQAVAAIFFLVDSIDEIILQIGAGIGFSVILECLVAVALVAGVEGGA